MLSASDAHLLAAFAKTADVGSYSAAATDLKLSEKVVRQRVKQLELLIGEPVFNRNVQRIEITETGAILLTEAAQIEEQLSFLSASLDAPSREPAGLLRVWATTDLATHFIAPIVGRFHMGCPRIRVEITSEEAQPRKLKSSVDVALRYGDLQDSRFIVQKICEQEEVIVSNSLTHDNFDHATRPRKLIGAPWVRHSLLDEMPIRFHGPRGATEEFTPLIAAETNSRATMLSMLVHGMGVGLMPEHLVREHLKKRKLIRLCPGWTGNRSTLVAVTPANQRKRHAIESFVRILQNHIADECAEWGWPTYLKRLGAINYMTP